MIIWELRPCTSLDNYETTAAVIKAKLKNTICVLWMRESARGFERNIGKSRFANGRM